MAGAPVHENQPNDEKVYLKDSSGLSVNCKSVPFIFPVQVETSRDTVREREGERQIMRE